MSFVERRSLAGHSIGLLLVVLAVTGASFGAVATTTAPAAQAADQADSAAAPQGQPAAGEGGESNGRVQRWWEMESVMRGWGGAKDTLSARGLSLDIGYTHVWQGNARGGLDTRHGHRHTGSYDAILQFDTAKAGLWKGGLFSVWMEGSLGRSIDETKVGSLVPVNGDYYTEHDFQVSTYWYEHRFLDEKVLLRFGKQDSANDFDTNRYANNEVTQFLNGGLINNPTIPFTDYGHGVQLGVIPTDWVYGQLGLFDAEAQGGRTGFDTAFHGASHFFLINEYGLTPTFRRGKKAYPGTYRAGYWYDPMPKEFFLQPDEDRVRMSSGDWGAYLSLDQRVWKQTEADEDEQGLGLFFRYGFAHGDVNTISNTYSYGLSYTGLLPSRDEDVLGLGFSHASLSEALGHVQPGMERETAIECFYNIRINRFLQVTPDMQVIVDPGGNEDLRNAIVVGVRLAAYF